MIDRLGFLGAVQRSVRARARQARAWALRAWRNPGRRERALATATFTLIAAFTAVSIDYLITGGPEWNPVGAAYAMEPPRPRVTATLATVIKTEAPPPFSRQVESIDYGVAAEELLGGPEYALASTDAPTTAFTIGLDGVPPFADWYHPVDGMDWR